MKFLTSVKHLLLLCSVLVPLSVTADLLDSVIFVGDSDVYYWGLQGNSDAFIPGSVNVGVSGWTCADVNGKINDWLEQYEPTLVIFKCGTNDMWGSGQVSPEEAFDRFTKVIDKISATNVPVIAMSTKPVSPVLVMQINLILSYCEV
jgi:lysophospholipase L1-like esterase